jgi:protein ImuB
MKRVLCVRLPDWPRQRRALREPELSDREALQRLVPWCESFSPTVGVADSESPDSLFFDVTGLAPLFCGEETLLEHVRHEFGRRGWTTRIALADTLGAAWALTHYVAGRETFPGSPIIVPAGQSRAAIGGLPIEALRLSPDCVSALNDLGLRQIGQLLELPRESLAARFGAAILRRLDQATGIVDEVIAAHHPPPEVEAEWTFEYPTDCPDLVQHVLQGQLEQITRQLSSRRQGVQELVFRWRCESGQPGQLKVGQIKVGLYRPSAVARHLVELIETQWQATCRPLAEPITSLRVSVTAVAPLEYYQQALFDDLQQQNNPREMALLVDRLASRLGRHCVVRPRLLPEAQPELAWRFIPLVGERRPAGGAPSKKKPSCRKSFGQADAAHPGPLTRPLSLVAKPLPVEMVSVAPHGPPAAFSLGGEQHHVARTWGPERIQTGWWRGRNIGRDYYRVETGDGRWFWLFRQLTDGRWFCHGAFA